MTRKSRPRPNRSADATLRPAALLAVFAVLCSAGALRAQSTGSNVSATKHNLTATGPGQVKVGTGSEPCQFCHTPHAASPMAPLWNRSDPGTYYETYESSTLVANVGQPTGTSRLCLSCHDGTIALAQTFNPRASAAGSTIHLSAGDRGYLGTDLRDDHPISFTYDSALASQQRELRDPATLPAHLPLDKNKQLQCTTCHDPHDDTFGKFLRMPNTRSAMCSTCHAPDSWPNSAHALSGAALSGARTDDWDNLTATTVQDAGCGACHRPHTAGGRERLLRHEAEEMNCLNCHDGSVARTDIAGDLNKFSAHNSRLYTGVHDPVENVLNMNKHVECADCHDPHGVTTTGVAQAPFVKPTMRGASGLSATGNPVATAQYEYEVCFKCHSTQNFASPTVRRLTGTDNIADEFSTSNQSYHPVQAVGRSSSVPSLVAGMNTTDILYCTDCHKSDDANGPKGPHGSRYDNLLANGYSTQFPTVESPAAYALCYSCHNRSSILADESFAGHKRHIAEQNTPCATCHDPHGVRTATHLVNFDADVVFPASNGQGPIFQDTGNQRGSCTLRCHTKDHINQTYE